MQQWTATNAVPLKRLTATLRDDSQIVWYNADDEKAMVACALDGDVEPVGSVVWPAGVAAISALERLSNARRGGLRGLSVLELGAGTGLTALAAAKFGARVVATDASELCLRLLRAARDANPDLSFAVEKLDFSDVAACVEINRQYRVDAVGCPKFDFHIGRRRRGASARARSVRPRGGVRHVLFDGAGQGHGGRDRLLARDGAARARPESADAPTIRG